MQRMFYGAKDFNGDISEWNTGVVVDTRYVARFLFCFRTLIDVILGGDWGLNLNFLFKKLRYMFKDAESFNRDISAWDMSNVLKTEGMFHKATSFNGDISQWKTSSVTDMPHMFRDASSFSGDLSNWDVSKVIDMVRQYSIVCIC